MDRREFLGTLSGVALLPSVADAADEMIPAGAPINFSSLPPPLATLPMILWARIRANAGQRLQDAYSFFGERPFCEEPVAIVGIRSIFGAARLADLMQFLGHSADEDSCEAGNCWSWRLRLLSNGKTMIDGPVCVFPVSARPVAQFSGEFSSFVIQPGQVVTLEIAGRPFVPNSDFDVMFLLDCQTSAVPPKPSSDPAPES